MAKSGCPFCGKEGGCDHNLLKFIVFLEPESYDAEGFREYLARWINADAIDIDEEILEVATLKPGKWGTNPVLTLEREDFLFTISELTGTNSPVLNDCLYQILTCISKDNLMIARHAYLASDDEIKTLIDDSLDRLLSTNDNLFLELQYWAEDWHKVATRANDYLSIFFSLRENIAILSKIAFEQTADELYRSMVVEQGPALHISRNLGDRLLHAMGQKPPDDPHRRVRKKTGLRITGVSSMWELMSREYRQYRDGFKVFMNFNAVADPTAHDIHKNLFMIGKYLVEKEKKDKLKDEATIMLEKAMTFRRTIGKIQTLICHKFGKSLNGRSFRDVLEELNKEGKIPPDVKANLSYLYALTSGLIHTSEKTSDQNSMFFDAGYFYDVLSRGFSHIFKNVLPVLE